MSQTNEWSAKMVVVVAKGENRPIREPSLRSLSAPSMTDTSAAPSPLSVPLFHENVYNTNTVESRDIYEGGNQLGINVSSVAEGLTRLTVVAQICHGRSCRLFAFWMTVPHIPRDKGCLQ